MGLSPLRGVKQTIKGRLLSQAERHALSSFVGYDEANHDLIQIEWGEMPSHNEEEEMVWKAAAVGLGFGPGTSRAAETSKSETQDPLSERVSPPRGSSRRGHGTVVAIEDAVGVLRACQENIKALWRDEAIQTLLKARRVRVQDMGGL